MESNVEYGEHSGYSKKRQIYHTSNVQGMFIVNAITGDAYSWRVGSLESRRLFKIVDAIGECDKLGVKMKVTDKNYPNPSPNHCYYDSPQQFMVHMKMTVQPQLIEQWEVNQYLFRQNNVPIQTE